ncbi:hypothetical protein ACLBXX_02695 [Microbacterium sp. C23T]
MPRIDLTESLEDARARIQAELPPDQRGLAKYEQLTRKETLLRDDQLPALTALARVLMGRRRRKVERITENTLIRVAIDLLLVHTDELRGSTEDELRTSVTPELRNSRSPEHSHSATAELRDSRTAEVEQSGTFEPRNFSTLEPAVAGSPAPRVPGSPNPGTNRAVEVRR